MVNISYGVNMFYPLAFEVLHFGVAHLNVHCVWFDLTYCEKNDAKNTNSKLPKSILQKPKKILYDQYIKSVSEVEHSMMITVGRLFVSYILQAKLDSMEKLLRFVYLLICFGQHLDHYSQLNRDSRSYSISWNNILRKLITVQQRKQKRNGLWNWYNLCSNQVLLMNKMETNLITPFCP